MSTKFRNRVRIVGGRWRGRRVPFAPVPGLRPTPDRVRETLFNWLQAVIEGARCLDLFAGSGVLGLEAASRGAARVVLVERDLQVVRVLEEQVRVLGSSAVQVAHAEARAWLARTPEPFDVVFLDPPFAGPELLATCIGLLEDGGWLRADARIYLEADARTPLPALPPSWSLLRSRRAGQVAYYLALRSSGQRGVTLT